MLESLLQNAYLGIIIVLILTGAGLPLPEEVPIIAAGVLAAHGHLNVWWALLSCLVGALLGDCVMYWVGHHFGKSFLREHPLFARIVHAEREARIERMLQRHGLKIFFLARFMVGVRSPMFLAAGILRVPFRRFITVDLFCATVVIGTFFGLSYVFAEQIHDWWLWIRRAEVALTVAVVAGILTVIGFLYWRHRRRVAAAAMPAVADRKADVTAAKPIEKTKSVA